MKPIFLVDCDNVLADTSSEVIKRINSKLGTDFAKADLKKWDIAESLHIDHALVCEIFASDSFCKNLKIMPNAKKGINLLRRLGEVICVTSPWYTSPSWMFDRHAWLREKLNFQASEIIQASSKHLIRGDILIDDCTKNIDNFPAKGILFSAPYNGELNAFDWDQIISYFTNEYYLESAAV
jgi:5'(3')-deoxyribonucleotidase